MHEKESVEDAFARSMVRCETWKAQGGKSRSNFWKTSDVSRIRIIVHNIEVTYSIEYEYYDNT